MGTGRHGDRQAWGQVGPARNAHLAQTPVPGAGVLWGYLDPNLVELVCERGGAGEALDKPFLASHNKDMSDAMGGDSGWRPSAR